MFSAMSGYNMDFTVMRKIAGGDHAVEYDIAVIHQVLNKPVGDTVHRLSIRWQERSRQSWGLQVKIKYQHSLAYLC